MMTLVGDKDMGTATEREGRAEGKRADLVYRLGGLVRVFSGGFAHVRGDDYLFSLYG